MATPRDDNYDVLYIRRFPQTVKRKLKIKAVQKKFKTLREFVIHLLTDAVKRSPGHDD